MTKKGFSVIHICIRTTACKWRYDIKSSIIMTTNLQQSVSPVRWNSISTLVQNPPRDICCVSGGSFGSPCRDWLAAGRLRLAAPPLPHPHPTHVCVLAFVSRRRAVYVVRTHTVVASSPSGAVTAASIHPSSDGRVVAIVTGIGGHSQLFTLARRPFHRQE